MLKIKFTSKYKEPLNKVSLDLNCFISDIKFKDNGKIKKKDGEYVLKTFSKDVDLDLLPESICYYNKELGNKLYPNLKISANEYLSNPEFKDMFDLFQHISMNAQMVNVKITYKNDKFKVKAKLYNSSILKVKIIEYNDKEDIEKKIKKLNKQVEKLFPFMEKNYVKDTIKVSSNIKNAYESIKELVSNFTK